MTERTNEPADSGQADRPATQKTRPAKGEPVEIPVPTREAFLRDLEKVAPPVPPSRRISARRTARPSEGRSPGTADR